MRASSCSRTVVLVGLAGVAFSTVVSAALLVAGYRPEPGPGGNAVLVVVLAVLGASLAVSWRAGTRVAPVVAGLATVVAPFARSPPGYATVGRFAMVPFVVATAFPLVVGVEWVGRNPGAARREATSRAGRVALLAGLGHAALSLGLRGAVFGFGFAGGAGDLFAVVVTGWFVVGTVLLGAVPAFLAVRHRLVSPALVVASLFALSAFGTWIRTRAASETGADVGAALTAFSAYLLAWVVVLAVALFAGGVEHLLRARYGSTTSPRETASR